MKKFLASILMLALCSCGSVPAFAANYSFGSGPSSGEIFGGATSSDNPVTPDPMSQNTRRNKDAAYFPPSYGVFSGDIPTGPTSLYHNNTPAGAGGSAQGGSFGGITGTSLSGGGEFAAGTSVLGNTDVSGGISVSYSNGMLPSTSVAASLNTAPWYYDDGTIGTLFIHKLNKTIKVFEGESLANMKSGIGHFTSTSAWDGNIGLAGHNRGASAYFGFVKNLEIGDTITYTTRYGERSYVIYSKEQISETDLSSLVWSDRNMLTLITCVENVPELRWKVLAECR